ncbi:hypothetical protein PO909_024688 [Leuciscus waleckii]
MRSALLLVLLVLLVTLMFTDASFPCQRSWNNNAYDQFKYRHILSSSFNTKSRRAWAEYLTTNRLCGRAPRQSFLNKNYKESIINICNGEGVKDRDNLCTSIRKFTVYIVQSSLSNGQCEVQVQSVRSYVVVACEVIGNQCLPVHYGTQTNWRPDQNGQICRP